MLKAQCPTRQLTADEVFLILASGSSTLTPASTLVEWDDELGVLSDDPLRDDRQIIAEWFRIGISRTEARAVLRPARSRTLRELAQFIAAKGVRAPAMTPVRIGGENSLEVGVFRALRAGLEMEGFRERLRPSTQVTHVLRSNGAALLSALGMLAPGSFCVVDGAPRRSSVLGWAHLVAGIVLLAGVKTGNPLLLLPGMLGVIALGVARLALYRPEMRSRSDLVVETVGDACRIMAGRDPRQ
jgi:hypothetical protein